MRNKRMQVLLGITAVSFFSMFAQTVSAAAISWKIATPNSDWGTASNWAEGAVPGSNDTVTIWGKAVVTYMPEITNNVGSVAYLGLNWNQDTNQTVKLTLTGADAFLKVSTGTYVNRSTASTNALDGISSEINIYDGAIFQTTRFRMGSGSDNSIAINVGADSELRVWNPIASTADIVDWGIGDHTINLLGVGATFSMTGPGDQSTLMQSWIDDGYITRDTETTTGYSFSFDSTKNLTTLTAVPEPTTVGLFGVSLCGMFLLRKRLF
ncbi:MAG: PEP-CTERM sorting domain-containing protein [Kiritimatiellales bacterium]